MIEHNNKRYFLINKHTLGWSLDFCVNELISEMIRDEKLYYMDFNETRFYSDEVSVNSAYQELFGIDYIELKQKMKEELIELERKENEYEKTIPNLITLYEEKGSKIVDKKYMEHLKEIIPYSLKGTYKGWDLDQAFELIQMLNEGKTMEELDQKLHEQNHSGFSVGLVIFITNELCDRGPEFKEYYQNKYCKKE